MFIRRQRQMGIRDRNPLLPQCTWRSWPPKTAGCAGRRKTVPGNVLNQTATAGRIDIKKGHGALFYVRLVWDCNRGVTLQKARHRHIRIYRCYPAPVINQTRPDYTYRQRAPSSYHSCLLVCNARRSRCRASPFAPAVPVLSFCEGSFISCWRWALE